MVRSMSRARRTPSFLKTSDAAADATAAHFRGRSVSAGILSDRMKAPRRAAAIGRWPRLGMDISLWDERSEIEGSWTVGVSIESGFYQLLAALGKIASGRIEGSREAA